MGRDTEMKMAHLSPIVYTENVLIRPHHYIFKSTLTCVHVKF